MKKFYVSLLSLALVIFVNACDSTGKESQTQQANDISAEQNIIHKIENVKIKEQNDLIYQVTPNNSNKKLTIFLPYSVENLNIKSIKLLQDNKNVTDQVTVNSKNIIDNKLYITLNEFIPSFNQAILTLENEQNVTINVGQYYFEKLDVKDNISFSSLKYMDKSYFNNKAGNLTYTAKFLSKKLSDAQDIKPILSKRVESNLVSKQLSFDKKNQTYELTLTLPKEELVKQNLDSITFDVVWLQENKGQESVVLSGSVPVSLEDY